MMGFPEDKQLRFRMLDLEEYYQQNFWQAQLKLKSNVQLRSKNGSFNMVAAKAS